MPDARENPDLRDDLIAEAKRLGFVAVGIAPAADDPYADPKYQVPDDLVW